MQGFPGADENRIANFKAYLERQVAANRNFAESFCVQRISKKLSAFKSNTFSLN
jgi:hypothetical protein